jgi:sarcosine oxidase, subunit beta
MAVDAETRRTRVPPEKIVTNLARLIAVAPHMRAHHVIRTWTGIEGYVADMMPVLGPSSTTPGLFHACAFSGHGLQLGPAACLALTELIVDRGTRMPIAAFDISRFGAAAAAPGRPLAEEFQADVLARESPAPRPG